MITASMSLSSPAKVRNGMQLDKVVEFYEKFYMLVKYYQGFAIPSLHAGYIFKETNPFRSLILPLSS